MITSANNQQLKQVSALLKKAKELGLPAADGKEMLIFQGAASFEIWTNQKALIEAMRKGYDQTE